MAIFHLDCKNISKENHRNFMACVAYRSGEKIKDEITGETFDYSKKKHGVTFSTLLFPYPENTGISRQDLWDRVQKTETRKNARFAKEIEISLPHELTDEQRKKLTLDFALDLVKKYGVAIDINIHKPPNKKNSDDRNFHAHLLLTTRAMTENGNFSNKSLLELADRDLKKMGLPTSREQIKIIRKDWANFVNKHLELAGIEDVISEKSYKEQGIKISPKPKLSRKEKFMIETNKKLPQNLEIKKQQILLCEKQKKIFETVNKKNNTSKANYIKNLLKFFPANENGRYHINLNFVGDFTTLGKNPRFIPKEYKIEQITDKTIGYLFARNRENYQVYFKCSDPHFILIDDIKDLSKCDEKFLPNLAVQTSPENWQFWYKIPQKFTTEECQLIQAELIEILGGDPAAKGITRNGRLPFFQNRKNDPKKHGFVTKIDYAKTENQVDFDEILRKAQEKKINIEFERKKVNIYNKIDKKSRNINIYEIFMKGYENKLRETGGDYSAAELAGAIAAIGNGADPEIIKTYLQEVIEATESRRNKKSRDYIERTVNKALEWVDNTPKMS